MRVAAFALVCAALVSANASAATDAAKPPKLPAALATATLCTTKEAPYRFAMTTLVQATLNANGSKLKPEQAFSILAEDLPLDDPRIAQYPELAQIAAYANAVLQGQWSAYFKPPSPAPSRQAYFKALIGDPDFRTKYEITCVAQIRGTPAATANPPPTDTASSLRLRGTPADLVAGKDSDSYAGASKTSFTLNNNQVSKTTTAQVAGALGYAWSFGPNQSFAFMPYVAGNYNASTTIGKPTKYTSDTLDGGFYLSKVVHYATYSDITLAAGPDYLHNYADGSSIISVSPIITPKIIGVLNNGKTTKALDFLPASFFGPSSTATYVTLFGDVRGDFGHFTDRGVGPDVLTNIDFAQIGVRFGIDVAKNKWYDFNIADLQQYGASGSRRYISDFESSLTYYGGAQDVVGLTASYKSGLIERTLQQEQVWALGVTAKY